MIPAPAMHALPVAPPRRRSLRHSTKRAFLRLLDLYPPFLGAGVRVRRLPEGYESRLHLRWWNRNYFGTHFGGSLYTMCDPFFVLHLTGRLGPGYVAWDKAATIHFRKPGRGTVRARFTISAERVAEIRAAADRDGKVEPTFETDVVDEQGEVVAHVEKLLHVRRKPA
jgi:acyl-coenzyme A thioesterase PaaI-like protein